MDHSKSSNSFEDGEISESANLKNLAPPGIAERTAEGTAFNNTTKHPLQSETNLSARGERDQQNWKPMTALKSQRPPVASRGSAPTGGQGMERQHFPQPMRAQREWAANSPQDSAFVYEDNAVQYGSHNREGNGNAARDPCFSDPYYFQRPPPGAPTRDFVHCGYESDSRYRWTSSADSLHRQPPRQENVFPATYSLNVPAPPSHLQPRFTPFPPPPPPPPPPTAPPRFAPPLPSANKVSGTSQSPLANTQRLKRTFPVEQEPSQPAAKEMKRSRENCFPATCPPPPPPADLTFTRRAVTASIAVVHNDNEIQHQGSTEAAAVARVSRKSKSQHPHTHRTSAPVGDKGVVESALNGEAVHFILPLTTAWVERENISQRFIFQHPQHDIELGGSIMGKGGVPTTTPPVDSSNEHSRKSRAAWGQGLMKSSKSKDAIKVETPVPHQEVQMNSEGNCIQSACVEDATALSAFVAESTDSNITPCSGSIVECSMIEPAPPIDGTQCDDQSVKVREVNCEDAALSSESIEQNDAVIEPNPIHQLDLVDVKIEVALDNVETKSFATVASTEGSQASTDIKESNMPACAEISRLPTKATVHAGIQIPTPKSTTKDGGASDAVNKEKRTVRDRMQLGSIFSRESDIHRAYNTIVYMLELQKSNIEAINPRAYQQIASLSNLLQEIKTVQAAAKLIIPRVSEINYALDLLHQTSENYYTVLKNYREKQYMLELRMKELKGEKFDRAFRGRLNKSCVSSSGTALDKLTSQFDHISPAEGLKFGLLADIQHHNKLRAIESHFHDTIVQSARPLSTVGCASVPTSNNNALSGDAKEALPSVSEACESSLKPSSGVSPQNLLFSSQGTTKRDAIVQEIRVRKLSKRKAWECLSGQYVAVLHKWNAHIDDIEKDEAASADKEGPKLRGAVPTSSSMRAGAGAGGVEDSLHFGDGEIRLHVNKPTMQHGRSVSSQSMQSAGFSGSGRQFYATSAGQQNSVLPPVVNGLIARSDYDQERLLNEIFAKELRQSRIDQGLVCVPAMRSPWPFADLCKSPNKIQWLSEVRKIRVASSESLSSDIAEGGYPLFKADYSDVVDCVGLRLTTDGRRQMCFLFGSSKPCALNCNCALQVEKLDNINRIWSDTEKSVFVDKFMQFPKNFHRIASFLPNRTTKDCVKFYYDAKASTEFKQLLKEHDNRRKQSKAIWNHSSKAAHAVGGALYPAAENDSKEFLAQIPADDQLFTTFVNQPPYLTKMFNAPISMFCHKFCLENEEGKTHLTQIYPRRDTISQSERRRVDGMLCSTGSANTDVFGSLISYFSGAKPDREGTDNMDWLMGAHQALFDKDDDVDNEVNVGELVTIEMARRKMQNTTLVGGVLSTEPFGSSFLYNFNAKRLSSYLLPMYTFQSGASGRTYYSELAGDEHTDAPPIVSVRPEAESSFVVPGGGALRYPMLPVATSTTLLETVGTGQAVRGNGAGGAHRGAAPTAADGRYGRGSGRGRGRGNLVGSIRNTPVLPSNTADISSGILSGRGRGRGRGRSGSATSIVGLGVTSGRGRGRGINNKLSANVHAPVVVRPVATMTESDPLHLSNEEPTRHSLATEDSALITSPDGERGNSQAALPLEIQRVSDLRQGRVCVDPMVGECVDDVNSAVSANIIMKLEEFSSGDAAT